MYYRKYRQDVWPIHPVAVLSIFTLIIEQIVQTHVRSRKEKKVLF